MSNAAVHKFYCYDQYLREQSKKLSASPKVDIANYLACNYNARHCYFIRQSD